MDSEWHFTDTVRLYARVVSEIGPLGALNWRNSKRRDVHISARTSKYPLLARGGSSDGQVFHQIFVEREYRCIDHLTDVRTIIDAGANVGYSSAYFLTRWPRAKVIALEPDPG